MNIRHKLAAFLKLPKSASLSIYLLSQLGTVGNRKVNGPHESRFFVISPGRIILRVGFKGSYVIFAIRPWGGTVQTLDAQTGIKYPVTKRGRWRGGLLFLPESQGRSCRHGMQGAYQPLPGVQSFRVSLFSLPVHPLFLMEVYSGPNSDSILSTHPPIPS